MLCPAPWSCLCLVSGLVSQSASLFFSLGRCVRLPGVVFLLSSVSSSIWASMLCPPPWSCLWLVSGFVSQLVYCWGSQCCLKCVHLGWVAVSLVLCFSCLRSCLPSCLPAVLECGVCGLGLSQEFYVRFVQLFGVYGGVTFFGRNCFILLMEEILHHLACTKRCKKWGKLQRGPP